VDQWPLLASYEWAQLQKTTINCIIVLGKQEGRHLSWSVVNHGIKILVLSTFVTDRMRAKNATGILIVHYSMVQVLKKVIVQSVSLMARSKAHELCVEQVSIIEDIWDYLDRL